MRGHGARRRGLGLAVLVAVLSAADPGGALAQEAMLPEAPSGIIVLDQERLFTDSAFGRASRANEEAAAKALEAENSRIQAELVAEEQELTLLRKTLGAEEFAAKAAAFDAKVERIRAEQDAKARELSRLREEDAKRFFAEVLPVLDAILQDRGAVVMLDISVAIRFRDSADITDEAIARIDAFLGDPAEVSP